jgi:hypothetical protein
MYVCMYACAGSRWTLKTKQPSFNRIDSFRHQIMGYQLLYEIHPFMITLVLLVLILALRELYFRRSISNSQICFIKILIAINLTIFIVFETYFNYFECAVSVRYQQTNSRLIREAMSIMNHHNMSYWLDFATLLNQLRNEKINSWDHDTDLSIIHPDYVNTTQYITVASNSLPAVNYVISNKMRALMDLFEMHGFSTSYDGARHLIQLWSQSHESGPHVDLWLWIPELHVDKQISLWTVDSAIKYNPRRLAHIFPLHRVTWINQTCFIPFDSHAISQREYSVYKTDYMQPKTFRTDCIHNMFYRRFLYWNWRYWQHVRSTRQVISYAQVYFEINV